MGEINKVGERAYINAYTHRRTHSYSNFGISDFVDDDESRYEWSMSGPVNFRIRYYFESLKSYFMNIYISIYVRLHMCMCTHDTFNLQMKFT